MAKEQIYENANSLKPIEKLTAEASSAISDPLRTVSDDREINEALVAAGGIGTGGAVGLAALYYGGSVVGLSAAGITSGLASAGAIVGGGMAAGIAVLAFPAIGLGVGGYALMSAYNKKKLMEKKEMLLQEVQRKHNAIIKELNDTSQKNEERTEYLSRLNTLLQAAVHDLKNDLAAQAS